MQVIILAGGRGTRLKPLTDTTPKLLLPLHNSVLLDHIIGHIKHNGCDNVIICTGNLGYKIEEYLKNKTYGIKIHLSMEQTPLGTAGALHLIKSRLEDDFFVLYGDVYTTINLQNMFKFHKKKNSHATLALHISDHPHDSTVVKINRNKKLIHFIEKPGDSWKEYGNLTTTPLYILQKDIVQFIPDQGMADLAKDIFPMMLNHRKKLYGYVTEEYAKDLGTPDRYQKVLELLQS